MSETAEEKLIRLAERLQNCHDTLGQINREIRSAVGAPESEWASLVLRLPRPLFEAYRFIEDEMGARAGMQKIGDAWSVGQRIAIFEIVIKALNEERNWLMAQADEWRQAGHA